MRPLFKTLPIDDESPDYSIDPAAVPVDHVAGDRLGRRAHATPMGRAVRDCRRAAHSGAHEGYRSAGPATGCPFWRVGSLRGRLLADRPLLMRIAWRVRQARLVHDLGLHRHHAPVAAARAGYPRDDTPIRLIPAPESYSDFQSPKLVVPSDVPRAEMTLPGAITVQMLHLLQDVYPVIASHQPLAAERSGAASQGRVLVGLPAGAERRRRGIPISRKARREGTLLGTLAVGRAVRQAR